MVDGRLNIIIVQGVGLEGIVSGFPHLGNQYRGVSESRGKWAGRRRGSPSLPLLRIHTYYPRSLVALSLGNIHLIWVLVNINIHQYFYKYSNGAEYQLVDSEYIKDITPKCSAFNLTFEVFKRVTDTETGSVYQISDQTGTCKLRLKPDLVKFIQEGKVYTASNLLPFLQNHLLILELAKDIGSLVKEPFILPFKDHSFDLSAVEWKVEKQIAKIESESIETKPTESEKSSSTLNSSSRVQPKHKPHSKVQFQAHKPYSKREYQTNRSHHNVQSSIRKPQPKVENQTNKPRDTKKKPSYIEKFSEQEEPNRSKVTTKPSFIKLLNLKGFQEKELVDVIVYVSNITEIEKQSWGKWTRFIECRLSDGTGSARGLFFGNTKIQNKQYYEFRNLRLKYVGGKIELQETKETTIRVSSSANFQPNPRQVEVHDSKY